MAEFRGVEFDGWTPLRCQLCGTQMGIKPPGAMIDPNIVVLRCYGCAAVEEAERITQGDPR